MGSLASGSFSVAVSSGLASDGLGAKGLSSSSSGAWSFEEYSQLATNSTEYHLLIIGLRAWNTSLADRVLFINESEREYQPLQGEVYNRINADLQLMVACFLKRYFQLYGSHGSGYSFTLENMLPAQRAVFLNTIAESFIAVNIDEQTKNPEIARSQELNYFVTVDSYRAHLTDDEYAAFSTKILHSFKQHIRTSEQFNLCARHLSTAEEIEHLLDLTISDNANFCLIQLHDPKFLYKLCLQHSVILMKVLCTEDVASQLTPNARLEILSLLPWKYERGVGSTPIPDVDSLCQSFKDVLPKTELSKFAKYQDQFTEHKKSFLAGVSREDTISLPRLRYNRCWLQAYHLLAMKKADPASSYMKSTSESDTRSKYSIYLQVLDNNRLEPESDEPDKAMDERRRHKW